MNISSLIQFLQSLCIDIISSQIEDFYRGESVDYFGDVCDVVLGEIEQLEGF